MSSVFPAGAVLKCFPLVTNVTEVAEEQLRLQHRFGIELRGAIFRKLRVITSSQGMIN